MVPKTPVAVFSSCYPLRFCALLCCKMNYCDFFIIGERAALLLNKSSEKEVVLTKGSFEVFCFLMNNAITWLLPEGLV